MKFNYSKICSNLLKDLPERQKVVLSRRFGLNLSSAPPVGGWRNGERRETLEFIGKYYGITRERVRQIEREGFLRLKPKTKHHQEAFQYFTNYFKIKGGLKKEDILLEQLGDKKEKNQIYFLLTLGEGFERFAETGDFYPLWATNKNSLVLAQKIIDSSSNLLSKTEKLLTLKDLNRLHSLSQPVLTSYLEISKEIKKNSEDLFGLKDWPEINPRGIKDKAYLVFKKEKNPLHFTEVANLIESTLPQTVHNELIKDYRFVLVGRGIYALKEWGYEEGCVKDIILKVLKENKKFLTKEEILEKVLKQRLVKENTILLNLSNKKYFSKTPEGFFTIKIKTV